MYLLDFRCDVLILGVPSVFFFFLPSPAFYPLSTDRNFRDFGLLRALFAMIDLE